MKTHINLHQISEKYGQIPIFTTKKAVPSISWQKKWIIILKKFSKR